MPNTIWGNLSRVLALLMSLMGYGIAIYVDFGNDPCITGNHPFTRQTFLPFFSGVFLFLTVADIDEIVDLFSWRTRTVLMLVSLLAVLLPALNTAFWEQWYLLCLSVALIAALATWLASYRIPLTKRLVDLTTLGVVVLWSIYFSQQIAPHYLR